MPSNSKYAELPTNVESSAHNQREPSENQERDYSHDDLSLFDYDSSALDYDIESSPHVGSGTSSMKMAFMNMANSILGAGIIGQPFAFRNSGLMGGIVIMFLLGFLIDWTLRLIILNSHLSQTRSYQDTVNHCFGRWGKLFLLFTISSFAYGGCMAFCVIIGDTIPHVLRSILPESLTDPSRSAFGFFFGRNSIIIIFTTCVSYPLSLNRDISKLAKASAFALVGMLIIVVLTVARGPFVDQTLKSPLSPTLLWINKTGIFQGISVISFALVCHHNTIFIYNSMRDASLSRFNKLTHWACAMSVAFCLLMGVSGLLNFGANTKGNILNNFKSSDQWINVARFCFGLNMLTTFPLEIFVVRDVLKEFILTAETPGSSTAHMDLTNKQHFFLTTGLVFSSMAVSLLTCNLGIILELIGATSASLMAYIIPPLCYLKLSIDQHDHKRADREEKINFIIWKALPSVLCALFGLAIMFISSYKTISTNLHNTNPSHCVVD